MKLVDEISEGLLISWDALRVNKLRSTLTTLGIVIGIVTVTVMGTAIEGINQSFHGTISQMGADVFYVQKMSPFDEIERWRFRNRKDFTMDDARLIARQAHFAQAVVPEAYYGVTIKRDNRSATGVGVLGTTDQGFLTRGFVMASGRFMSSAESDGGRPVCVLGADVAMQFFPNESPIGQRLLLNGNTFEVVGVMAPVDKFLGMGSDNHVIIPLTKLAELFQPRPNVTILVKIPDMAQLDEAREELRGLIRKIRQIAPGAPDDFSIIQQDVFVQFFNRVGGLLATLALGVTGLSLFVGGIGIMNIMFVSVTERTREIGIRKAIGARRRTILVQFLLEAACICLFGGLIGLAIAYPITRGIAQVLPATFSLKVIAAALTVAAVTGIVSGFLPAWRAARMDPVDALRSE